MSRTVAVSKCANCPFFERSVFNMLGKLLSVDITSGHCRYVVGKDGAADEFVAEVRPGLPQGPERDREIARAKRRLEIVDKNLPPPDACPLRSGDVAVTLGS